MFGLFGKRPGKAIKSTRPEPTYEMNDDPVIGYVLLHEPVSRDRIIEALNDHVSEEDQLEWDEDSADEDSLGRSILPWALRKGMPLCVGGGPSKVICGYS